MKTTLLTLIALTLATSLCASPRGERASPVERPQAERPQTERTAPQTDHSAGDEHEIEYDVSAGV